MTLPRNEGNVGLSTVVLLCKELRADTSPEFLQWCRPPASNELDNITDPRLQLVLQKEQDSVSQAHHLIAPDRLVEIERSKRYRVRICLGNDEMIHIE